MAIRLFKTTIPLAVDCSPYIICRNVDALERSFHSASRCSTYSANKEYKVSPEFINRNPRNLEFLGLAWKRQGWQLQQPRRDYYHKLIFKQSLRNIEGSIEHSSGKTVISASTKEWSILQFLHGSTDVSAAENVGRVLARRCHECGIDSVFYDEHPKDKQSEKMQAFLNAVLEGDVNLEEIEYHEEPYKPGIDYDKPNRYGRKKLDDIQVS